MKSRQLARVAVIVVFALLATPVALLPQEKPANAKDNSQFQYRTGTNLVLVPVVVSDKQGHHVSGLTAEDFELKQDGNLQKIASVEEVTAEATRAQRQALAPNAFSNQIGVERPKKLEILTLDLVNNPFIGQVDATRGLIGFLSKGSSEDTLMALVVFQQNGVHLIHNFTTDPGVLIGALQKVQAAPNATDTHTLDVEGDLNAEYAQLVAILNGSPGVPSGSAADQMNAARGQLNAASALLDRSRSNQNGQVTMECFQQVAQYFAAVPGRKSLIWASVGFNFSLGSMTGEAVGGTTMEEWDRTTRMLQDANIAVYPVDVGGLLPTSAQQSATNLGNMLVIKSDAPDSGVGYRSAGLQAVEAGQFLNPGEQKHETMRIVADRTGGRPYYNLNDIDDLFRRASLDSGQYYMLSYSTKDTGKNGWRKLSVKVRRDGVQVRHRSGFFYRNPSRDSDAARSADLRTALDSNVNFSSLPITGSWQQVEPAGDKRRIHFLLSIPPGVTAIDADQENHISMDFAVSAVDTTGKEAARLGQRVDRKLLAPQASQLQATGMGYSNTLTLAPGSYTVHFVVRDNLRGTTGSVVAPLRVN